MKSFLCLLAAFAIAATATADDVPGPVLEERFPSAPYYASPPGPNYGPQLHAGGNSFHIFYGPPADSGLSNEGYYNGPVFESYHAGSHMVPADVPIAPYSYNTGIYGPMMLDVLLMPEMSRRGGSHHGGSHRRW